MYVRERERERGWHEGKRRCRHKDEERERERVRREWTKGKLAAQKIVRPRAGSYGCLHRLYDRVLNSSSDAFAAATLPTTPLLPYLTGIWNLTDFNYAQRSWENISFNFNVSTYFFIFIFFRLKSQSNRQCRSLRLLCTCHREIRCVSVDRRNNNNK